MGYDIMIRMKKIPLDYLMRMGQTEVEWEGCGCTGDNNGEISSIRCAATSCVPSYRIRAERNASVLPEPAGGQIKRAPHMT